MKLHSDFYYRHPRLVKMSKVSLFDALNDLIIWMLRVLNDGQNCFVLLDNNTEQKEITPATYHFVKAAEYLVWELSFFYGQRYNMR